MPIFNTVRKLVCCAAGEQEVDEAAAPARLPAQEPVAGGTGEQGRPHRDYVEDEATSYWRDIFNPGSLVKPDREELRAAALPVLARALRRRRGELREPAFYAERAHRAVGALQQHTAETGWITQPVFRLSEYPRHEDALLHLADDAGWLYREIPLPEHPDPQHPPIYYTLDPLTRRPVPTDDSLIRADYVYDPMDGSRITQADHIPPWRTPGIAPTMGDLTARGWDACYTFGTSRSGSWDRPLDPASESVLIAYYWINPTQAPHFRMRCDRRAHTKLAFTDHVLKGMHFSPYPPTPEYIAYFRTMVRLLLLPVT